VKHETETDEGEFMLIETGSEPDILEVIADLSNDEVFTPPRVANAVLDLLPAEVWTDSSLRWLDPGCKTGVFLREATKRLMVGLADEFPDEQERLDHILRNQMFGIATTELTSLMSRRTLYCSKEANGPESTVAMQTSSGNLWYQRVEHSYTKGRCSECSASETEMERPGRDNHCYALIHAGGRHALRKAIDMKFDVIVGNPPYQMEADSSGKNVVAIYHLFVEQAKALNPRFLSMVIPSRWMLGVRGLDGFQAGMLSEGNLSALVDYPNSAELFPTVDIKSGICYFLWERDRTGKCMSTLSRAGTIVGPVERDLSEFDVLVRDSRAVPILRRVLAREEGMLSDLVSPRDPFGPDLGSNYTDFRKVQRDGDVRLYMNQESAVSALWTERTAATRHKDLIDVWKVFIPKAGPGNSGGHVVPDVVLSRPVAAPPNSVCSATYLVAGPLNSESEAKNLCAYVRTRFVRFLISLRKPSQNTTQDCYGWVPQQTWDREWTDEALYDKYGITPDEQAYIAEMIREMPA
jgi:Eco57I restriction-modification methylase